MKILLVTTPKITGLNYHRQLVPHNHLLKNYDGYQITPCVSLNQLSDEKLEEFDIVTFLRIIDLNGNTQNIINRARSFGAKVILDIDDYWELHKDHEQNHNYKTNNYAKHAIEAVTHVDYVTTTTEHFANKLRQYNKNVLVFPNSIDPKEPQFKVEPKDSDRVRIGWIGGIFHQQDLAMVYNGFKEVWKGIKHDKFQLCLGGWNYPDKLEYVKARLKDSPFDTRTRKMFQTFERNLTIGADVPNHLIFNKMFDNIPPYDLIEEYFTDYHKYPKDKEYQDYLQKRTGKDNDNWNSQPYKRLLGLEATEYAKMYNEIDVALVPLQENSFNSYKSQIKIIEAGYFKKAAIVSNVMPYTIDCTRENCELINPNKRNTGWGAAMKSLILNKDKREDLAEALHEKVKEKYMIEIVNKKRHEFYQSLA
jgi:glycosyltransferase involved in cell wall biosynthesis